MPVIFFFGRKRRKDDDDDDDDFGDDEELVKFQGTLNGVQPDLIANEKLVEAGLDRAKEVLANAIARRAGALRFDPKADRFLTTLVIDGVPFASERLPKQEGLAVTQVLKLLGGMNVKDRRNQQTGGMKIEYRDRKMELRLSSVGVEGGERLLIRVSDPANKLDTLTELGLDEDFRTKIRTTGSQKGLFFVVGPPGSGTSTTFFAVLRGLDPYLHQIFTLGDTDDRHLDNITAFSKNEGDDLDTNLQRVLRVDGDILQVDPPKDADALKTMMKYAEDASILSEFPSRDVASALQVLNSWSGDPEQFSKVINGVLSQKLLRVLCPKCKQAFKPNPQFLKRVGLPESTSLLYRAPSADDDAAHCRKCGGTGYLGRKAIFEFIEMTDDMRALIATSPDPAAIRAQMKKDEAITFQRDGLRLIASGDTSLEELQRVFKAG
ncbi:MAG: Flp pilus assembly complex ATPase component TadA [Planctomycetaceae bacterium]|nr:Flp pilus assembly complex ATPase component TadA [Planctomycetaceae bacterium]